jgi:voltage-gated potassium channel Kch
MTVLWLPVGVAIVAVVFVDVLLTTLHPSRPGPFSAGIRRLTWRILSHLSHGQRHAGILGWSGPVIVASNILAWIGGLWLGYALIYLPSVDTLAYAPSVAFGHRGLLEALYLSAVALTTVGFGDVVASTDALRLVTTLEAASGFGVITAAISYVLSLYPMLNRTRAAAEGASQLGLTSIDAAVATVTASQGLQHASSLHREVVNAHHAVRRFPVLFYFTTSNEHESIVALVEAATTVSVLLCWGVDARRVPHAQVLGPALAAAVRTLLEDHKDGFRGLLGADGKPLAASHTAVQRLRATVARHDPSLAAPAEQSVEGFEDFVSDMQRLIDDLRRAYRYAPRALFGATRRRGGQRP